MRRFLLLSLCLAAVSRLLWSATETVHTTPPPAAEENESPLSDETEQEQGSIPHNAGLYISTQPVTPISQYAEKAPYDQALDELEQARALWQKGDDESTSDMALQAYEDLLTIHGGRGKKNAKKRAKVRADRYQAATLYVNASISYVKEFVHRNGKTPSAIDEGKARLEDLRDVSREYEDLNKHVSSTMEELSVK
jgi:hypothetical protein